MSKPCIELDLDEARAEVAVLRSLLDASSRSDKRLRAHLASVRDWIKYAANSDGGICADIDIGEADTIPDPEPAAWHLPDDLLDEAEREEQKRLRDAGEPEPASHEWHVLGDRLDAAEWEAQERLRADADAEREAEREEEAGEELEAGMKAGSGSLRFFPWGVVQRIG